MPYTYQSKKELLEDIERVRDAYKRNTKNFIWNAALISALAISIGIGGFAYNNYRKSMIEHEYESKPVQITQEVGEAQNGLEDVIENGDFGNLDGEEPIAEITEPDQDNEINLGERINTPIANDFAEEIDTEVRFIEERDEILEGLNDHRDKIWETNIGTDQYYSFELSTSRSYMSSGYFYFGTWQGDLYKIDLDDGSKVWHLNYPGRIFTHPKEGTRDGETVMLAIVRETYELNPNNGNITLIPERWIYGIPGESPNNSLYEYVTEYGRIIKRNLSNGDEVWRRNYDYVWSFSNPVLHNGQIKIIADAYYQINTNNGGITQVPTRE